MLIHWACDNDIHPPLFGSTQRIFGLARGLATRAEVRALCVVPNRSRGAREERAAGVDLRRVRSWHTSAAWWLERARLRPLFTAEAGHRARASRYRTVLGGEPDVLVCDLALTGLFGGARGALRVYHAQNVEAACWPVTAPPVLARGRWAARLTAFERRAVHDSDLCLACTDEDAALLRSLHGAREVEVVPNGFDETALAPPPAEARARARAALGIPADHYVFAFVGGDWGPNREALDHLVGDVLPALAGEGFTLLTVGGVARHVAARRVPGLVARSETLDLATLLSAADCGVNPVARGGGSNVKLPTYLAMGLAVVTTAFGLRGYAPLADAVETASREDTVAALRARPRGWAARGEPAPAALAGYAWGALGARLADSFAARVAARRRGVA